MVRRVEEDAVRRLGTGQSVVGRKVPPARCDQVSDGRLRAPGASVIDRHRGRVFEDGSDDLLKALYAIGTGEQGAISDECVVDESLVRLEGPALRIGAIAELHSRIGYLKTQARSFREERGSARCRRRPDRR